MPAAAAQIRPLAWELPYAAGVAKKKKTSKKPSKTNTDQWNRIGSPETGVPIVAQHKRI